MSTDRAKLLRAHAFYVVRHPRLRFVKFGISGRPDLRLRQHAEDGLRDVLRLRTDLGEGVALGMEEGLKEHLRGLGLSPIFGHEYFPGYVEAAVLQWVDRAHADRLLRALTVAERDPEQYGRTGALEDWEMGLYNDVPA